MTAISLRVRSGALRHTAEIALGVAVLTASAKANVPFWPVPMTLQPLAVLLLAGLGGSRAIPAVAAYLLLGAAGAPVFATSAGLPALLGPTGGYLIGFLVATLFIARMGLARGVHPVRAFATLLAADGLILLCGVLWLSTLVGPAHAVQGGLLPFIPGELVKVGIATAVLALRRRA